MEVHELGLGSELVEGQPSFEELAVGLRIFHVEALFKFLYLFADYTEFLFDQEQHF